MLRRVHEDQRGMSSSDYAGILVVVSLVFLALFALNLDEKIAPAVKQSVCTILGGEDCGEQRDAGGCADHGCPGERVADGTAYSAAPARRGKGRHRRS